MALHIPRITWLHTQQVAEYLGVTVHAVRRWRERGEGPPFVRFTRGAVRYRRTDIDAWVRRNTVGTPAEGISESSALEMLEQICDVLGIVRDRTVTESVSDGDT